MIPYLVMVPVAYLLGSIPTGLIIVRLFKRVDVRDYGSGKTGMTNVLRTLGAPAAAAVMLLDMAKAILAVAIARYVFDSSGVETVTFKGLEAFLVTYSSALLTSSMVLW